MIHVQRREVASEHCPSRLPLEWRRGGPTCEEWAGRAQPPACRERVHSRSGRRAAVRVGAHAAMGCGWRSPLLPALFRGLTRGRCAELQEAE